MNNNALNALYGSVKEWGGQDSLRHHFDLGSMYAREVRLKAGEVACMHVHAYDHWSLYVGHLQIVTDEGTDELIGVGTVFIARNRRHAICAITDTLWICAHRAENLIEDMNVVTVTGHA